MKNDRNRNKKKEPILIHMDSFDLSGKLPGSYVGGVVKLASNPEKDLLASATSFLKAAARCLNNSKVEQDTEMLTVPGTVCASFSCELFLKYILLVETGKSHKGHCLAGLFRKCNKETQHSLIELKKNILEILERNNSQFIETRYHHEIERISFRQQELLQTAEFLLKFVTERYEKERLNNFRIA